MLYQFSNKQEASMSQKLIHILSLTTLLSHQVADAANFENEASRSQMYQLQKKTLGFDPKYAINTLNFLASIGVDKFNIDGTVVISTFDLPDLMTNANFEGLRVKLIANVDGEWLRVHLKGEETHQKTLLNNDEANRILELSKMFNFRCDMDGKVGR